MNNSCVGARTAVDYDGRVGGPGRQGRRRERHPSPSAHSLAAADLFIKINEPARAAGARLRRRHAAQHFCDPYTERALFIFRIIRMSKIEARRVSARVEDDGCSTPHSENSSGPSMTL
ncbi:hypothetical protein EVAR_95067_1 [Eumeta japonica]|uniref:Uncharacterized protein n=1 Tax=Eumeta variegata TaxID=151549 RepID=A0A4C1W8Y2_EUMVA|nr:hypothetical protein EVAR_95067_1 [Eumeta japonica]